MRLQWPSPAMAVSSRKVKNFALLAKDFKLGQLSAGPKGDRGDRGPVGPTFAATAQPAGDPPANPDEPTAANPNRRFAFTLQ